MRFCFLTSVFLTHLPPVSFAFAPAKTRSPGGFPLPDIGVSATETGSLMRDAPEIQDVFSVRHVKDQLRSRNTYFDQVPLRGLQPARLPGNTPLSPQVKDTMKEHRGQKEIFLRNRRSVVDPFNSENLSNGDPENRVKSSSASSKGSELKKVFSIRSSIKHRSLVPRVISEEYRNDIKTYKEATEQARKQIKSLDRAYGQSQRGGPLGFTKEITDQILEDIKDFEKSPTVQLTRTRAHKEALQQTLSKLRKDGYRTEAKAYEQTLNEFIKTREELFNKAKLFRNRVKEHESSKAGTSKASGSKNSDPFLLSPEEVQRQIKDLKGTIDELGVGIAKYKDNYGDKSSEGLTQEQKDSLDNMFLRLEIKVGEKEKALDTYQRARETLRIRVKKLRRAGRIKEAKDYEKVVTKFINLQDKAIRIGMNMSPEQQAKQGASGSKRS